MILEQSSVRRCKSCGDWCEEGRRCDACRAARGAAWGGWHGEDASPGQENAIRELEDALSVLEGDLPG